jgi:hypothetical protein
MYAETTISGGNRKMRRARLLLAVVLVGLGLAKCAQAPKEEKTGSETPQTSAAKPSVVPFEVTAKPSEAVALMNLQAFMDAAKPGVWKVEKVEKTDGFNKNFGGTPGYVMEAKITVRVVKLASIGIEEVMNHQWMMKLQGKEGAQKILSTNLRWIKTEKGWKFKGID